MEIESVIFCLNII